MAAIDTYDAVVLGSGEAGKSIAWHLGGTGKRVVVVEQRYVGGSCPNIACLPSKNFVHGASIAHTVATSEALGTRVARNVSMREIQARKRTMVEGLVQTHLNKFAASGCELVMGERDERLLPREDRDIAEAIRQLLEDEGIAIITSADVSRVSGRSGDRVALHAMIGGTQKIIEGSHLLVALGKTPNTNGIGLERAGIELTSSGYVSVNDRLETTAAAVWAMGDCAGSPAFTHMAFDDFRIVRDNLRGRQRSTTGRQVPFCLFIEPELARVGLNEVDAKRQGVAYRLAELPISSILRTRTTGETRGKLKALIGEDDRILGFTAFGPQAGELLPPVQIAMRTGLSYHAIEELVVAHPTYAEGLVSLFSNIKPPPLDSKAG